MSMLALRPIPATSCGLDPWKTGQGEVGQPQGGARLHLPGWQTAPSPASWTGSHHMLYRPCSCRLTNTTNSSSADPFVASLLHYKQQYM